MALVSRRGVTLPGKIAWTPAFWLVSVAPLLLLAGFLYNWGGERTYADRQITRAVHAIFKPVLSPKPSRTPSPTTHHHKHR
ncbi:MAG TPA: hypothetical protein VFA96_00645 [Nocardioides sp.]|nr:hypothetical protein [Nocardioides sp.]